MKKILFILLAGTVCFASCKKDKNNPKDKIFKSAVQQFQHGQAWSWYEVDDNDKPVRLAIAIDSMAMATLDRTAPGGEGHHHVNMISVPVPQQASATPFRHVGLDWNPAGHEPAGIYDKPHFDFHFYMISDADRMAIPDYATAPAKFDNYPAPGFMPPTYVPSPGGVPQMGAHWIDVTSPELNGAPFTETFLYGSYDAKVIFYEPMITEAFVLANPSFERAIPQPVKFQQDGYYPTKMRIAKSNGITSVILEGFVYKTKP